jgi:hypothetical protein
MTHLSPDEQATVDELRAFRGDGSAESDCYIENLSAKAATLIERMAAERQGARAAALERAAQLADNAAGSKFNSHKETVMARAIAAGIRVLAAKETEG